MNRNQISGRILSILCLFTVLIIATACPLSENNDKDGDTTTTDFTASDGTKVSIVSPVTVTVAELNSSAYPDGPVTCIFEITGTLSQGETAIITFTCSAALTTNNSIAYYNGTAWVTVESTIDGNTISCTVDHFSEFAVVDVSEPETSISGTVNIGGLIGDAAWKSTFGDVLCGKYVYIMLFDTSWVQVSDKFEKLQLAPTVPSIQDELEYELSNLTAGMYYMYAYIDMDGDGVPAEDEPQNTAFSGEDICLIELEAGESVEDIDIILDLVYISGSVTIDEDIEAQLNGEQVYMVLVIDEDDYALDNDNIIPPRYVTQDFSQVLSGPDYAFNLTGIPTARYYIGAYVDINADTEIALEGENGETGEPYGLWEECIDESVSPENANWLSAFPVTGNMTSIPIEIAFMAPAVEIDAPVDEEVFGTFDITISGTITDEGDIPTGGFELDLLIYRWEDIDFSGDSPAPTEDPVYENSGLHSNTTGTCTWTDSIDGDDLNYVEGTYVIFVEGIDAQGLPGSDIVTFTIQIP